MSDHEPLPRGTNTSIRISCELSDYLLNELQLSVVSGCTDLDGEFHSNPQIDTVWGVDDIPVVECHRYPERYDLGDVPPPDRQPCEHWLLLREGDRRDV